MKPKHRSAIWLASVIGVAGACIGLIEMGNPRSEAAPDLGAEEKQESSGPDLSIFEWNLTGPTEVPSQCGTYTYEVKIAKSHNAALDQIIWQKQYISPLPGKFTLPRADKDLKELKDPKELERFILPIERIGIVGVGHEQEKESPIDRVESTAVFDQKKGGTWQIPFCVDGRYRMTVTVVWQELGKGVSGKIGLIARHLDSRNLYINAGVK
jgi:hypothetical protein